MQSMKLGSLAAPTLSIVVHWLSQQILNFLMCMLGCKVALEQQDTSIGAMLDVSIIRMYHII